MSHQHLDLIGLTIAGNVLIALIQKGVLSSEEANAILSNAITAATNGDEIKGNPDNQHIDNLFANIEVATPPQNN